MKGRGPDQDGDFLTGLAYAIPISAVLWALIIWLS